MSLPALGSDWEPTRATLQKYAHAVTALPRVGADPDPQWAHVSLHPVRSPAGVEAFSSAPVAMSNGTTLVSTFDVLAGSIVTSAGEEYLTFVLSDGPSPHSIGTAIAELAASQGTVLSVDSERYADEDAQEYNEDDALAWFTNSAWVVSVFDELNATLDGTTRGPHIWPHGFDLATEWISSKVIEDSDGANAQIAVGFYPAGEPYFYANPWPFDPAWATVTPPHGASWNTDGWNGVKLDVADLDGSDDRQAVLDMAAFVHSLAGPALS